MELKCQHVSASEAGDEIFQILFKEKREQENGPYLLISRAFLEEDEGEPSPVYIETQDEQLIGHYPTVDAELTRSHLTIRLPSPADDTIEVQFVTSDREFKRIKLMLGIILQRNSGTEEKRHANKEVHRIPHPRRVRNPVTSDVRQHCLDEGQNIDEQRKMRATGDAAVTTETAQHVAKITAYAATTVIIITFWTCVLGLTPDELFWRVWVISLNTVLTVFVITGHIPQPTRHRTALWRADNRSKFWICVLLGFVLGNALGLFFLWFERQT